MSEQYYNPEDMSPLSFEKNNNVQSDLDLSNKELSFPSSTISSSILLTRTTTDESSVNLTNNRKYAGATPIKRASASSPEISEISQSKSDNESAATETESNDAISVLQSLIDENNALLEKNRQMTSQDKNSESDDKQDESDDNQDESDITNRKPIKEPLSENDSSNVKSENSYVTVDACYDSDVDMFSESDSPINVTQVSLPEPLSTQRPLNLADFSSEFVDEKSYFAPENVFSLRESSLKLELLDVSMEEIQCAVGKIIESLESSDKEL